MTPRYTFLLVAVCGLVLAVRAAEPDPQLAADEKTLGDKGIDPTGPELLRFFKERTLTEADVVALPDAVKRLGDDDFETREKAAADLVRAGRKALPFVRAAVNDKDPERARRAQACVEEIDSRQEQTLAIAAAHVLADRKPDGATDLLLAYLPANDDEDVEEAVVHTLAAVGVKAGEPAPALVKALTDKHPRKRLAAAHVLGRHVPKQRAAVRRLLADSDTRVRFEAAESLVRAGDKEAVPALIGLLADGPMTLGWRAQEILCRIAGDKAPTAGLSEEAPAKRAAVADAWRGWWQDAAAKTDLAKIKLEDLLQGLNVVSEIPNDENSGSVWACRADGKRVWELKGVSSPVDAQLLPNGHVLVGEWHTQQVTERDMTGKIVWTFKAGGSLATCRRLPNGNTLVGTTSEVIMVDPKGTRLWSYKDPGGSHYRVHLLPNGHVLLAGNMKITELDTKGAVKRTIPFTGLGGDWTSIDVAPGDHFLVSVRSANKVIEIDSAGKQVWQANVNNPMSIQRLPNGNVLVACYVQGADCVELDRTGKEVLRIKVPTKAFAVRRF